MGASTKTPVLWMGQIRNKVLATDLPENTRIYMCDKEGPTVASAVVSVATLTFYVGFMSWFTILCFASFFSRVALTILAVLLGTLLLPAKPNPWPQVMSLWIFQTWRDYFQFSFLSEQHLEHDKHYVLAEYPHGAFPIGTIVAGTVVPTLWPTLKIYALAATSVFYIPVWRHFIAWIGSVPATRGNFKRLLKKGSVAVVVGGIAEMFMADKKRERIKLRDRRGFCKIALEEQADGIVPLYYFGQSQVLNFGPRWLMTASRRWRISFGILTGVLGLPLPRPLNIYLVQGKPVPVPKVSKSDPDFEKQVDLLLASVVDATQILYDRHKVEYGWADRPLSIE